MELGEEEIGPPIFPSFLSSPTELVLLSNRCGGVTERGEHKILSGHTHALPIAITMSNRKIPEKSASNDRGRQPDLAGSISLSGRSVPFFLSHGQLRVLLLLFPQK